MTDTPTSPTLADEFERRDWWKAAGDVIGLSLLGWTDYKRATFYYDHPNFSVKREIQIDGEIAARLKALRRSPDASGEYARGLRDAARVAKNWKARSVTHLDECLDQVSHDEHWGQIIGPQIADAILALPQSAAVETSHRRVIT